MKIKRTGLLCALALSWIFLGTVSGHAQYERIQLRVYGLDCELCARGVAASVLRLDGVNSVVVHLKEGVILVELKPGNNFKMSSLRRRIKENGFRSTEATVTALGRLEGSRFEVTGSGESYEITAAEAKSLSSADELTFQAK